MMLRALAILTGAGRCPSCGGKLLEHEAGFYVCASAYCSAAVDYASGSWVYGLDPTRRRLPGLSGIPFDRRAPHEQQSEAA